MRTALFAYLFVFNGDFPGGMRMIECKFNPYSAEYRMLTMEIMPVSREVEDAVQAGMFPFFISHEYQRLYKLVRANFG